MRPTPLSPPPSNWYWHRVGAWHTLLGGQCILTGPAEATLASGPGDLKGLGREEWKPYGRSVPKRSTPSPKTPLSRGLGTSLSPLTAWGRVGRGSGGWGWRWGEALERFLPDKAQGWDEWQEEAEPGPQNHRQAGSREAPAPPGPAPLPPPAPLRAGPRCLSPSSQPQGEQRAEVAGSSDLAVGGGLNGHTLPTWQPPPVPQAQRPRWGAEGHVTDRWQLQKHTLVLLLDFHPVTPSPA